jgi:ribosomal protein S18 acetylase RimI-like enzyme
VIIVEPLQHHDAATARRLHAVLVTAYAQEAALLGVQQFAPLGRTAEDIQRSADLHLGALRGDMLLGAVSVGPDDEAEQLCITSLVVHPVHQRQGVGRALLTEVLRLGRAQAFAVSTAAANAPALALYREFGFVAYRQGVMGAESLPVVKLRRPASGEAPKTAIS